MQQPCQKLKWVLGHFFHCHARQNLSDVTVTPLSYEGYHMINNDLTFHVTMYDHVCALTVHMHVSITVPTSEYKLNATTNKSWMGNGMECKDCKV